MREARMEDAVQDVDPFNGEPRLCQIGPRDPRGLV